MVLQAMLEAGATPEEIAKVMVEQKLLQAIGTSPGVNFINVLRAAFAPVDPKSVKRN